MLCNIDAECELGSLEPWVQVKRGPQRGPFSDAMSEFALHLVASVRRHTALRRSMVAHEDLSSVYVSFSMWAQCIRAFSDHVSQAVHLPELDTFAHILCYHAAEHIGADGLREFHLADQQLHTDPIEVRESRLTLFREFVDNRMALANWRCDMDTNKGLTFDRFMQAIIICCEQLYDWVPEDGIQSISDHMTSLNNAICEKLRTIAASSTLAAQSPTPVPSGGSDGRASSDDLVRLMHRNRPGPYHRSLE